MGEVIGPGHELYADLELAQQAQGGEVVGHGGLYYYRWTDNGVAYYGLIERKPDRDSLGKVSKVWRGWYPPKVQE